MLAAKPPWRPRARAGRCAGWERLSWPGCGPRWTGARPPWGWGEDQRWTLDRVAALIGSLSRVRYTLRGTSYLLHRIGYTPQVPVHRAAERDEAKIAAWRAETWAKVRG